MNLLQADSSRCWPSCCWPPAQRAPPARALRRQATFQPRNRPLPRNRQRRHHRRARRSLWRRRHPKRRRGRATRSWSPGSMDCGSEKRRGSTGRSSGRSIAAINRSWSTGRSSWMGSSGTSSADLVSRPPPGAQPARTRPPHSTVRSGLAGRRGPERTARFGSRKRSRSAPTLRVRWMSSRPASVPVHRLLRR